MLITTLCYIEHRDRVLMLHRTKKEDDINEGKWIGVGGKFLDRESPEDCLLREVREETGYELRRWRFRGFITFLQENYETEYMCLYTADDFLAPAGAGGDGDPGAEHSGAGGRAAGDAPAGAGVSGFLPVGEHPGFSGRPAEDWPVPDCAEGELAWIPKAKIPGLSLWAGDRIFLRLLAEDRPFFSLKLRYSGDDLVEALLDGAPMD